MYKTIHKEIRKNIREAKKEWFTDKCVEIEQLQTKQSA